MNKDTFLSEIEGRVEAAPVPWTVESDPSGFWISVRPEGVRSPAQGWKLHVSAGLSSAQAVLEQVLHVLLADPTPFKVTRSAGELDLLNSGAAGMSQVGKFVTIYPTDDAQALRLAAALHDATVGLRGPRVPSDQPFVTGSLVHYRYGGFTGRWARLESGTMAAVMMAPDGELVVDARAVKPPSWAQDPFAARGAASATPSSTVIAGRYLVLASVEQSARGGVYRAVDLEQPRRCIVKQARRDALLSLAGTDARDRLRAEARSLAALGNGGPWPEFFGLVEDGDDLFLVEEELTGANLGHELTQAATLGHHPEDLQIARWGERLAEALERIHRVGLVLRDLKATNVIVGDDRELKLIDLECVRVGDAPAIGALGTRGYCSPQQIEGAPAHPSDDLYGLGALLWFMATGADPSAAPDPRHLLDRPVRVLNPGIDRRLAELIDRCLEPLRADRFDAALTVAAALGEMAGSLAAPTTTPTTSTSRPPTDPAVVVAGFPDDRAGFRDLAAAVGRCLQGRAVRQPSGALSWMSAGGPVIADLAEGDAGVVLALSALHAVAPDDSLIETIAAGAAGLRDAPRLADPPLAGLYIGEAGVAAGLLAAADALQDADLRAAAVAHGSLVAGLPFGPADFMNGSAGRVRLHLWMHQATGLEQCLHDAVAAGDHLLSLANRDGDSVWWTDHTGLGSSPTDRVLGYAHGAAGIADPLLDLYQASGEERFAACAAAAARWLTDLAIPALDSGTGITWPVIANAPGARIAWCHGTAGVAAFLRHAEALDLTAPAPDLVRRSARTVALGTRNQGPTQCHGLAGSIDFLLDTAQATSDTNLIDDANTLGQILATFVPMSMLLDDPVAANAEPPTPSIQAKLPLPTEYLEGLAGVLAAFVRLGEADTMPSLTGATWWYTALDTNGHGRSPSAPAG